MPRITLSPEDRERVAQLIQRNFPGACTTPEDYARDRIEAWDEFVSREIEAGYEFTREDYLNDLGLRDWIEEILQVLSPEGYRLVASLVEPIDRRFRRATRYVRRSVWYPAERRSRYWWYHRIPKRMGEDLRRDLRAFDIIDD